MLSLGTVGSVWCVCAYVEGDGEKEAMEHWGERERERVREREGRGEGERENKIHFQFFSSLRL